MRQRAGVFWFYASLPRRWPAIRKKAPFLHRRTGADFRKWSEVDHNKTGLVSYNPSTPAKDIFGANASCILAPDNANGPYFVSQELIRQNVSEGIPGVPMHLELQFIDINTCEPADVLIDIWSCNTTGKYSGVSARGQGGLHTTWLRGVQKTDADGVVRFDTNFPGHYDFRATHQHIVVHVGSQVLPNGTYSGGKVAHLSQLFFDQDLRDAVEALPPYNTNRIRATTNLADGFTGYSASSAYDPLVNYAVLGTELTSGLFAWHELGINTSSNWDTYSLNRRVHDVKTYPVLSPQGSTVLVYGHENGVTVLWRGGRRLKPTKPQSSKPAAGSKTNGAGASADDGVMIIDSDDDDDTSAPAAFVDKPEFEDENVEDTTGYPEVIQSLDLAFGTDILHIAVPPIAPRIPGEQLSESDVLAETMVFAVTSAKGSIFMLTLPLTPPSHESIAREDLRSNLLAGAVGQGKWGETLIQLGGQSKSPDGIAITLLPRRAGSSDRNKSPARLGGSAGRAVVAVHGKDASGTLRLWDIPLKTTSDSPAIEPFQTEYLPIGRRDSLVSMMNGGPERLAAVKGGVEVVQLPSARGSVPTEESAVLWMGGSDNIVCVIPVVAKFWDAQVRRSAGGGVNLFSGAQPSRMVRLVELNAGLLGERCCGVVATPKAQRRQSSQNLDDPDATAEESTGLPVEVIVRGESRLVVVHDFQDVDTAPLRFPAKNLKRLLPANEAAEPVNAIIVHQNPGRNAMRLQKFDLSIRSGRDGAQPPSAGLFGRSLNQSQDAFEAEPIDYQPELTETPSRSRNMGLEFMDELDAAADAGYELDAEDRDIEQEVMDLMELDQQLEQMEDERLRGTKRVFFEEDDSHIPSSPHGCPAVTEKEVFFERYTDSPEFSRVRNPVVHMRNRTRLDDDEDASDVIDPSSKLANYQSPMDRLKWDPMDLRRLAAFGAHKQAYANTATKNHDKPKAVKTAHSVDLDLLVDDEENLEDDDDEEPEDDTFEFLLK
ncbi:hypothetical protein INS49_003810 [Diaporthe citri]|uniref:uncharacterized protein n=1 Tax=Diaporthe citri TaxID=83186 RepID=UPI001C814A40|nr:uncharacterized protein INS49_003810 [Diaporthe citri]KAG6354729.1 hypothetical protein INS49_003810 [Diaporthe citri]